MNRKISYNLNERYANIRPETDIDQPVVPQLQEDAKPKAKLKLKSRDEGLTENKKNTNSGNIEDKLDRLLSEIEGLKDLHKKLLTEHNIIPKDSEEMYLQINGHLFKGNMNLIEKQ